MDQEIICKISIIAILQSHRQTIVQVILLKSSLPLTGSKLDTCNLAASSQILAQFQATLLICFLQYGKFICTGWAKKSRVRLLITNTKILYTWRFVNPKMKQGSLNPNICSVMFIIPRIIRRFVIPKVCYSDGLLFRWFVIPKVHYSDGSLF